MDLHGKHIILGSGSPRRRELLKGLDIDFEVDTRNHFEERFSPTAVQYTVGATYNGDAQVVHFR